MMHLMSLDTSYIINTPVRLDGNESEDEKVHKSISKYIEKDENEVHKDKKP